jgi:hypothetical protein
MMDLNVNSTNFLAQATVPIAPQQDFRFYCCVETHVSRSLAYNH